VRDDKTDTKRNENSGDEFVRTLQHGIASDFHQIDRRQLPDLITHLTVRMHIKKKKFRCILYLRSDTVFLHQLCDANIKKHCSYFADRRQQTTQDTHTHTHTHTNSCYRFASVVKLQRIVGRQAHVQTLARRFACEMVLRVRVFWNIRH
jgi:hypothetical protein